MRNYVIELGSIFAMLLLSLVAVYLGFFLAGVVFFLLAVTPLPSALAHAVKDRLVTPDPVRHPARDAAEHSARRRGSG